jgi:hypothetical protein
LLTNLSVHDLLAAKLKIKRKEIIKTYSYKKYAALGILMLFFGLALSLLPAQSITPAKKVIFIDQNSYEPDEIEKQNIETILPLSSRQLDLDGSWKILDETAILYENGYAETPFMDFKPGSYEFKFEASGSKAFEEFSKIWIAFLIIQDKILMLEDRAKEIMLSGEMKSYHHTLNIQKDQIGKIRIHFFNDKEDFQGNNRNVWIRSIEIRRIQ